MILKTPSIPISLGMRNDDVIQVQKVMKALGRSVPPGEKGVLGAGTVAVLKALQVELSLPATGVVDAATVKAINGKLSALATDLRTVRGLVLDANGRPSTNGFVQLFSQGSNGEQVIGKSALNSTDGSYQISYPPPPNSNGRIDLRVAVGNTRTDHAGRRFSRLNRRCDTRPYKRLPCIIC